MQEFKAYVIRLGRGYLGRKHTYKRYAPQPFEKARVFFRHCDAVQAFVPFEYKVDKEILPVSVIRES